MNTAGKNKIVECNVAAYKGEEFLGYVKDVIARGSVVYCNVGTWKRRFNEKRAIATRRSAESALICYIQDGRKFYPKADGLTFKVILD